MKNPGWIGALAVVSLLIVGGMTLVADDGAPSPSGLAEVMLADLVVEPSTEHVGAYECRATIVDTRTGETVAAPQILFLSGQDATIRSGVVVEGQEASLGMLVTANAEERTAQVRVELTTPSGTTSVQKLRFRL